MNRSGAERIKMIALWIPSIVWMAVIFRLSSIPGSRLPGGYSALGHFVSYAVLGASLYVPLSRLRSRGEAVAIAVLIASFWGVTDEYHQSFVPMRTPDIADWGIDTFGALAGAYACTLVAGVIGRRAEARRP